jgi:hypothetical protein
VVRHRVSLAGNRRLNKVMHMVAVCQARIRKLFLSKFITASRGRCDVDNKCAEWPMAALPSAATVTRSVLK